MKIDPTRDYYEVLGVAVDAESDEIRQAYRKLAMELHPDTGHGDRRRFQQVAEAYQILSDPVWRKAYERQRLSRGLGTGPLSIELLQSRQALPLMDAVQVLYVVADIRPNEGLRGTRKRLNLALVIDRSTSMQGARMENVKRAAVDLLGSLNPDDRLALVTFSDRAEVVMAGPLSDGAHRFRSAIASIVAEGGTEIYQGLQVGIEQTLPYVAPDVVSHVILLTDGRTYGDEDQALEAATRADERGVGVSAFGIGGDWNDFFLDALARQGGGTSQYIDSVSKVQREMRAQIRGLSNIALRRGRVRLTTSPQASLAGAYRVAPFMAILPVGEANSFSLGDLSGRETSVLALEFHIEPMSKASTARIARLVVEGEAVASGRRVEMWRDIKASFAESPEDQGIPPRLLSIMSRLSIFQLQERAWTALQGGDAHQATHYLESTAARLFDLGYRELGQAAMLEAARITHGHRPTSVGRKQLRYGTRTLTIPSL
ncbi:MAG: DnaJ domain-containing protein [Anaerolineae bacterium]